MITRWLESTSILIVKERIYGHQFKSHYLKNVRIFAALLFHFLYIHAISNVLKKTQISLIAQVFPKLLTRKYVVIWMHNRASFLKPFPGEHLNSPKNWWNLRKSTFTVLFLHYEWNCIRKSYFQSDLRF